MEPANVPPDTVGGFQTAEQLPRVDRTLNFRATVRDNRGGVNEADAHSSRSGGQGWIVELDQIERRNPSAAARGVSA